MTRVRGPSLRARSGSGRAIRRVLAFLALAGAAAGQDEAPPDAAERAEIDLLRRRGELPQALAFLDEAGAAEFTDAAWLELLARCRFEAGDHAAALAAAERADTLAAADPAIAAAAARTRAGILTELGRAAEAVEVLAARAAVLRPARDSRDAWVLASALRAAGRRADAAGILPQGAEAEAPGDWTALLAQARCRRALGRLEAAASALVAADRLAAAGEGTEPDVLVELGSLYFEVYGEVEDPVSVRHSPAELFREALTLHGAHEGAQCGLFELHRFNWHRQRTTPDAILDGLLAARPRSISGLLARTSAALDDGDLPTARAALSSLAAIAPGRRDVQAEKAALAWVEHRRDDARAILAALLEGDPADAEPERTVGAHLVELYRFAEALPLLARAVERDPHDWRAWRELGRAQANTGDEEAARASLDRSVAEAGGRRDAWRDNTALVLRRMREGMSEHRVPELAFAWDPDAARILETYLVPFYAAAREELAERYGYTPGPVKIEVFRRWADFSVRSTGFEGFPALGVCFGPVVTAVSPVSEMRGRFSWARTSYHEFTHVIHLGLSHNRCPRWVTEGLATWEEERRDPAWNRNLRRELIDARANGTILPIRRLNGAFRGPRVVFAYYQSGLLIGMLVDEHGFAPMVRLLEAFDRGLDLDQALGEVFGVTPEELDARLLDRLDRLLAPLALEPRWSPERVFRLRFTLAPRPPANAAAAPAWADDWITVAWGERQAEKEIDAEEALRIAALAGPLPPRGLILKAELQLVRGARDEARATYAAAFAAGGEDFRARIALAALLEEEGDVEGVERELRAAESAFPGIDDPDLSAELRLAALFEREGRTAEAMAARMRWLAYNADAYAPRVTVAAWLAGEGRAEESLRYWREANEVDPFRRALHEGWGSALAALRRHEEAAGEFQAALAVPAALDGDLPPEGAGVDPGVAAEARRAWDAREPGIRGRLALSLAARGRKEEARAEAERALALDPACAPAQEALAALGGE
ncbi:MAG: tetratricopeptide repeat protein [Planctomycetota bacterium]